MSKQTHIFATRVDLEPGLKLIEFQRSLRYVVLQLYKSSEYQVYRSLLEVDQLGINTTGDHTRADHYLVVGATVEVKMRAVPQRKGGVHYFVNIDPTSITFWPGGLYEKRCLISGDIGTASDDPDSIKLYREFTRAVTKGFKKVGNYYVGPEALRFLDQGVRLITMGIDEPVEYDLKR